MPVRDFNVMRNPARGGGRLVAARRGYTLIEMLICVLIIQVISGMVIVNVGGVDSAERLDRASQETIIALRYARMLAMSGYPSALNNYATYGVAFDTSQQTISCVERTGAAAPYTYSVVSDRQMPGGTYVINLATKGDVSGVKIQANPAPQLAGQSDNPYYCMYGALGATENNGSVTLTYGGRSRVVNIPAVGEPQ